MVCQQDNDKENLATQFRVTVEKLGCFNVPEKNF